MAKKGRPRMIQPPDLLKLFKDYVKAVKGNPILVKDWVGKDADQVNREKERPLTMEAFENYVEDVGGPADLGHIFSNRNNAYNDFVTICSRIKREIRADQIEGGMAGIYNPSITQRLNSLKDISEVDANLNHSFDITLKL